MEGVYPVQPVISEHELRQYIQVMDTDQEVCSFVYAFGGATLNLTRYGDSRTDKVVRMIEHLMDCSIDSVLPARRHYRSSVMRAMQSMFIHNCLMSTTSPDTEENRWNACEPSDTVTRMHYAKAPVLQSASTSAFVNSANSV
jgi:hypothetical protein